MNPCDVTAPFPFMLFVASFSFISFPSFISFCKGALIVSVSITTTCILWIIGHSDVSMAQRVHLDDTLAKRGEREREEWERGDEGEEKGWGRRGRKEGWEEEGGKGRGGCSIIPH